MSDTQLDRMEALLVEIATHTVPGYQKQAPNPFASKEEPTAISRTQEEIDVFLADFDGKFPDADPLKRAEELNKFLADK